MSLLNSITNDITDLVNSMNNYNNDVSNILINTNNSIQQNEHSIETIIGKLKK